MSDDRSSSSATLNELHDRLGAMIDQIGQPDYSLRELVNGLREVRDDLLRLVPSSTTESSELLARLDALAEKATQGPYHVAHDDADDCSYHKGSGLAMIDTGREGDWPVLRFGEWPTTEFIAALLNAWPQIRTALSATKESFDHDHPIARLQVGPDGVVPTGTVNALELWKEEADRLSALYYELLYQVGNKCPGETRHQTALRYLQRAERGSDTPAQEARSDSKSLDK